MQTILYADLVSSTPPQQGLSTEYQMCKSI